MKRHLSAILVVLSAVAGFAAGVRLDSTVAAEQASPPPKAIVTGIGGVFFKARDPETLRAWYREHLGIDAGEQGVNFFWREAGDPDRFGRTVWSVFPEKTTYFGPGEQSLMINYRVGDLDAALARLRSKGVRQLGNTEAYWYGRFAWIEDAEGNRIELWEPDTLDPEEFGERMRRETAER